MTSGRGLLQRIASPDPRRRLELIDSIVANVRSILNTQKGDGFTCPDLGCDFAELMSRWPTSEADVLTAVRRAIEQYEPRLGRVQVSRVQRESNKLVLHITGYLRKSSVRDRVEFRTEMSGHGHVSIT